MVADKARAGVITSVSSKLWPVTSMIFKEKLFESIQQFTIAPPIEFEQHLPNSDLIKFFDLKVTGVDMLGENMEINQHGA